MASEKKRRWSELSHRRQAAIFAAAVGQVTLLVGALVDLRRRPARKIRGDKRIWTALSFVNYVGPIAYFTLGRRR
jgi:hypothetical protein